jgi:Armadillo/beta-catenin-like repeat
MCDIRIIQAVVDCNALETLVPCLEEFDPTVKEAASWAIGYIAQHTAGWFMIFTKLFLVLYGGILMNVVV